MRLLFQYFGGGGGLSNVILLLKAYVQEFPLDELVVVCSEGSELEQLKCFHNVNLVSVKRGRFPEVTRLFLGLYGIKKFAKKHRVDVVWSLNLGSYRRLPVPNVLGVNNAYQVYPWKIYKLHPGSPLRVGLLRFFFRLSLSVSDAVLAQTNLIGSYVKKINTAPENILIVPKAVEGGSEVVSSVLPTGLAEKIELSKKRGFRNWLYVSTAFPHKNHRVLLEAFSELAKRGGGDCLVLTITQEEAISIGGNKVLDLCESGRIIFTGWVKKQHLRALYDACDACLMPSFIESLSSAHLEAMEWGKPQIVADLPYARDLCGDAAIYVDADNVFLWADAIQKLGDDNSTKMRLIDNGKIIMKGFPRSWSDCARRIRFGFLKLLND